MGKKHKKQFAGMTFALFFLLMAVCTVLSRAAASVLVPRVQTETSRRGNLSFQTTGKGVIETKEAVLVTLESGLKIARTAENGKSIKKGDVLLEYDLEYLQKTVEKKKVEVQKLEIALKEAKLQSEPQARVLAAESAGKTLELAEAQLGQRQQEYEEQYRLYESQWAEAQQVLEEEQNAAWEERQAQESLAQTQAEQGNEEEAQNILLQAEEAYQQRLSQAQAAYEGTISQIEGELLQKEEAMKSQEEAVAQAQNSYASAQAEDAAAAQNDEKTRQAGQYSQETAQTDLDLAKKELENLKTIQQEGGKLTAQQDGVVKSSNVQSGNLTDEASCLILGCGGLQVKGTLSAEELSKAEKEDTVKITIPGQGKATEVLIREVTTESSQSHATAQAESGEAEQAGGYFYADFDNTTAVVGTQISYEITKQTERAYEQVISLESVRKDDNGYFCLAAEPVETILGTEYEAKRIEITIEAKDNKQAAIVSNLGAESLVIKGSNKDISQGDKVRLEE